MDPLGHVMNHGKGSTKKRTGNPRRLWSKNEERVLMDALKDLLTKGYKSENGFRTGYLNKLEDALKAKFPKMDLRINPNITSKLTTWKKTYASLVTAHGTTGVGFNSTTNTIDYTDEQWEAVLERDPNMKGMRYKEWPLFPEWVEVFGKDRATESIAEDVPDMADFMQNQYGGQNDSYEPDFNSQSYFNENDGNNQQYTQSNVNEEQTADSTAYTTKSAPPSSSQGRKRKSKYVDSAMKVVEVLGNYCQTTSERLDKIASRIGYDHDLGVKRNQVFGLLGSVPGLSILDKLDISEYIGARVECLEMFMTLDEDAHAVYAPRILARTKAD